MSRYGNLVYGGVSSAQYGIYIADVNDDDMPSRDYSAISVPGRSRDIHFDNGRYANIDRTYKCAAYSMEGQRADERASAYIAKLMRLSGYQRIEDTLHPEYYKLGEFKGGTKPELAMDKNAASFDLAFDCDARKYLKAGEREMAFSSGTQMIMNPETEPASPLLIITGTGYIQIGSRRITVSTNPGTMVIDCELGDAYAQDTHVNYNSYISLNSGDFPILESGANNITVSGLSSCKITPRWCKL